MAKPALQRDKSDNMNSKKAVPLDAMQNVPRVLPWKSWNEWAQVRDAIFSSDPGHQAAAIRRISTWRVRGRCPHAVDSTAQLIETKLNDHNASSLTYATDISDQPLRSCYAMCVVRAVNGIVDGGQKGTHAMSIQKLARKVKLPVWVVELRHDSTHNNLPHLPLLRLALDTILNWFYSEYWEAQSKFLSDIHTLCNGIIRRFDKGVRGEGHRAGVDDLALKTALTDLPNSTLASMFIPSLLDENQSINSPFADHQESQTYSIYSSAGTVMIPSSSQYPATIDGVKKLYFKVLPLLEALQAQWVGFSESLLTQVVEEYLLTCDESTDVVERRETRLFFLRSWVKLLLSRDWICRLLAPSAPLQPQGKRKTSGGRSTSKQNHIEATDTTDFIKLPDSIQEAFCNIDTPGARVANSIAHFPNPESQQGDQAGLKKRKFNTRSNVSLRQVPHDTWSEEETNFMLTSCPVTVLADQLGSQEPTEKFGSDHVSCRVLRLALWISTHKLQEASLTGRLEDSMLKQLDSVLVAPFQGNIPSVSDESDVCEIQWDWVPCPIGSMPGSTHTTLDICL